MKPTPKRTLHNHTPFSPEEVEALPVVGRVRSNWRERHVIIYQHPTELGRVISVGTTFDNRMQVIADEPRSSWPTDLLPDRIVVTN